MGKKALSNSLTEDQELFCREYIKDLNGKQAAIRAGYAEASAEVQACRLLSHDKVKHFVQVLMDKRNAKLEVSSDDVLRELMKIGYADIRQIFNEDGTIKDPKDWPDDIAKCIASIEVLEEHEGYGKDKVFIGYTKKVKFWDKTKCLELIGKHKQLFSDTLNVNINGNLADRLAKARARKGK